MEPLLIYLRREEGVDLDKGHKQVAVTSVAIADGVLYKWSQTAPNPGMGYDKVHAEVHFSDQELVFTTRVDLVNGRYPSLVTWFPPAVQTKIMRMIDRLMLSSPG